MKFPTLSPDTIRAKLDHLNKYQAMKEITGENNKELALENKGRKRSDGSHCVLRDRVECSTELVLQEH